MLLAVAYHYVAERAPVEPRAIFPVTTEALAAQVELLAATYQLVSRDELVDAVAGSRSLPDRACVLTFDDGLRCQVELALPVLERLDVPAIFFVPAMPLAERRVLNVHKLHALRERLDDATFQQRLSEALGAAGIEPPEISDGEAQRHYRYDSPAAARLKFLLNVALAPSARDQIVGSMFAAEIDEAILADELYVSRDQVAELERERRALGAHSYAHEPLASLSNDELRADLARSRELLSEITGSPPLALSYPYGTGSSVDERVASVARTTGYSVGFTMERGVNETLDEPLLLKRLDTNDAPGGLRPRPALVEPLARR